MVTSISKTPQKNKFRSALKQLEREVLSFLQANWLGFGLILLATLIFFWPVVTRIDTYSEGGDAMFNAWTLARDHHCIIRDSCPTYSDGNIFFPNKDTMLYSETQLSAGLLTLPLFFINNNPLFSYNVLTILSFLFAGWFMYLLAKYLSKGNEFYSILAGLVFELAPMKVAEYSHLQSLSIFCLPLAVLALLKFFDTNNKKHLIGLFIVLVYQFFASWYQMIFTLIVIFGILLGLLFFRIIKWRPALIAASVVLFAILTTAPLAKEYIRFSKINNAKFSLNEQVMFSASVEDYFIPNSATALGKAYYESKKGIQIDSYNQDGVSYHGIILYLTALVVMFGALINRKKNRTELRNSKFVATLSVVGLIGFVVSLGPLLKIKGSYLYTIVHDGNIAQAMIPMPYALIDKFVPQLAFLRAVGRASIIVLFILCCFLCLLPRYIGHLKKFVQYGVAGLILAFIVMDVLPNQRVRMLHTAHSYNLQVPKVYEFIKKNDSIDSLIILATDKDYPGAGLPFAVPEQVLWAGYHNKNIFNGYSGYSPPSYEKDYANFLDFDAKDVERLRELRIHYVLVDKYLSSSKSDLSSKAHRFLAQVVYDDQRFTLYSVN